MFLLKCILVIILVTSGIKAQAPFILSGKTFATSFVGVRSGLDNEKRAAIFCTNSNQERTNEDLHNYVRGHLDVDDITYYRLDDSQYQICCELLRLVPRLNQIMLVLYFDGNAVQFPFNKDERINLLSEFSRLGWKPVEVRLEEFLKQNPHNQDALSVLYARTVEKLSLGLRGRVSTNRDNNNDVLSSFIKVLKLIVEAEALDWMTHGLTSVRSLYYLETLGNLSTLKESSELQLVLKDIIDLIEKAIKQRPFSAQFRYAYWARFSAMLKYRPDPMDFLRELSFPKGNYRMMNIIFHIAQTYIANPNIDEDGKPIVNEAIKFLNNGGEWILEQDPYLDGAFKDAYIGWAVAKAQFLIEFQHYSELEKHLEDVRINVGSNWNEIVNDLKKPASNRRTRQFNDMPQSNKRRIDVLLELPALVQNVKHFNAILVSHNFTQESFDKLRGALSQRKVRFYLTQDRTLSRNSWSLYNLNVLVKSGLITPVEDDTSGVSELGELLELIQEEELKNLRILERFIGSNPDHFDAMDMYCEEAEKFLPDEELEQKMLNYSRFTHTPPSLNAYSKMNNKAEWSRLASRVIGEEILRLNDAPISSVRNPWLNLSRWEDLDMQRNSIDWYAILNNLVFWYAPTYYFNALEQPMPEVVFIKYLNQADSAGNWNAVLAACRTRFNFEKKDCKNERILTIWEKAEEKQLNSFAMVL